MKCGSVIADYQQPNVRQGAQRIYSAFDGAKTDCR